MSTHELDTAVLHEAAGGHGHDRQWIAFGTVRPDTSNASADQRSVAFKDANGNVLPWPTVQVELHPSGEVASCRVANSCAGVGEGEWDPFVAGDEVIVAIPEGDERAGCTIIGRLNQTKDVFPTSVAGQDPTTNTFAFKRIRAPYILESATSLLFRQGTTNSFISIDQTGNVTIAEGSANGFLHVGADFLALQTGDNSTLLQLDPTKKQVLLQADTMQMILDAANAQIMTKGKLSIAVSGAAASGHAVTIEQVCVLLSACLALVNTAYAATASSATALALVTSAIPTAATLPLGTMSAALLLALQTPPDNTGTAPGVGRAGLLI